MFSFDFCEILRTPFCGNRTTPGDWFSAISTSFAKKLFCRFFNGFYIWLLYAILTNSPVSIWHNFLQKSSEILILIPIIPQNILKLYAKKSTVNMTELSSWKEIFSSGMSLTCPDLYRLIFQTSYHFLNITKTRNWWNSKFSKFLQVVHK